MKLMYCKKCNMIAFRHSRLEGTHSIYDFDFRRSDYYPDTSTDDRYYSETIKIECIDCGTELTEIEVNEKQLKQIRKKYERYCKNAT